MEEYIFPVITCLSAHEMLSVASSARFGSDSDIMAIGNSRVTGAKDCVEDIVLLLTGKACQSLQYLIEKHRKSF